MDLYENIFMTCARCGLKEYVRRRNTGFWYVVKVGDVCGRCAHELESTSGYVKHEWQSKEHGYTRVMMKRRTG